MKASDLHRPVPRERRRPLRLRPARRGDAGHERRAPRLAHQLRPGPPRAGGRVHGRRVGAAHRPGGRVPGDARARRDEPRHGRSPTRTSTARRVVAITGQAGRDRLHKESHQYVDIVEAFRPLTKWNTQSRRREVIPEVVRKAFKRRPGGEARGVPHRAAGGRRARRPPRARPSRVYQPRRPSPDRPSLARAADIMNRADRPLIFAGNGVIRGRRVAGAARRWPSAPRSRCVTTFMAKGAMPADHPLMLATGRARRRGHRARRVRQGRRRSSPWATTRWSTRRAAGTRGRKRASSTSTSPPAEVDGATSRTSRSSPTCARRSSSWRRSWRVRPHAMPPSRRAPDARGGRRRLPGAPAADHGRSRGARSRREDLVISDVGAHKLWVARRTARGVPNTVIISNGFAAMGIGLPGAIAAKLAQPERRVVTVTGDGGFLMNVQELETARRLGPRLRRAGLARRRLRRHPLEAAEALRADRRRRPRQPRLGGAGRGLRLPRASASSRRRRSGRPSRPPWPRGAGPRRLPVDYAENDRLDRNSPHHQEAGLIRSAKAGGGDFDPGHGS